jgi:prolipoprotein diacylglyceryltransferase
MIEPLWYDFRVITQPLFGGFLTPYSMIFSLCAAGGLVLSIWLSKENKFLLLDAGLGALFLSLIGARTGFVLRNLPYFKINPVEIPQLWLGGLSWPGALIGFTLALVAIHLLKKEPLGEMADSFLPLIGVMVLAAWLTGWWSGVGYGHQTSAWYGIAVRDILGLVSKRWPLPILGAVFSGAWIIGTILFPLKRVRKPGFRAVLAIAGLTGINLSLSFFREDPAPQFLSLRWESWFSIAFLVCALALMFTQREKAN